MRGLIVVALLTSAACAAPPPPVPQSRLPALDPGAYLACRDFSPVARDVNAGVLTNAEFRTQMRGVYDHAKVWPESAVARLSQRLLQIVTNGGTDDELKAGFLDLVTACNEWDRRSP